MSEGGFLLCRDKSAGTYLPFPPPFLSFTFLSVPFRSFPFLLPFGLIQFVLYCFGSAVFYFFLLWWFFHDLFSFFEMRNSRQHCLVSQSLPLPHRHSGRDGAHPSSSSSSSSIPLKLLCPLPNVDVHCNVDGAFLPHNCRTGGIHIGC